MRGLGGRGFVRGLGGRNCVRGFRGAGFCDIIFRPYIKIRLTKRLTKGCFKTNIIQGSKGIRQCPIN